MDSDILVLNQLLAREVSRCYTLSLTLCVSLDIPVSARPLLQIGQDCIDSSTHVRYQDEHINFRLSLLSYIFNFFCHGTNSISSTFC